MEKNIYIPQNLLDKAKVTLYGDMFQFYTDKGLYLSGNSPLFSGNYYDFYSNIKSLSANFKPFYGIPIEYTLINENEVMFSLPVNTPIGDYDVVFCNPAGYAIASWTRNFNKIVVTEFIPEELAGLTSGNTIVSFSNTVLETIKKYPTAS